MSTPVVRSDTAVGDDDARPPAASFAALALQLLLVLLVIRVFHVEERRGLFPLGCLAAAGWLVHRRLPAALRPAFFLVLSLASFPLAFSWPHLAGADWSRLTATDWSQVAVAAAIQSAWVFGLGAGLIVFCHFPLPFVVRIGLILATAAALAVWRSEDVSPFWAVLGSMFMFRLWIYLRELRRETRPASWPQRISYFFLLPNAFFPFFPIVDYRRFRDGLTADDDGSVAQRGVAWILRGIVHLLLYRAVRIFLLPHPLDLVDPGYVALFLVTSYALYLQVSGTFHVITGLLHLFGYDLPRTHDRYFLASSLSDIWRRINIYWKDFLSDHVFFPAYFALRRLPRGVAVVAAVLATFAATWLLHSWQTFWLIGTFPFEARDAALWLSAGTLVALNSVMQYRAALRGPRPAADLTPGLALRRSLQVAATFLAVSLFWGCWTIPQFPRVLTAAVVSENARPRDFAVPAAVLGAAVAFGTVAQLAAARLKKSGFEPRFPLERSPLACVASLILLAAVGQPEVHARLGWNASRAVASLATDPSGLDAAAGMMQGYYEQLADANLQSAPLIGATAANRPRGAFNYFDATRQIGGLIEQELIPGWDAEVDGFHLKVNRWGMRDDDAFRRKPAGTYRIAVVGSSVTMGYGVPADDDFESLVERRLNETLGPNGPRVELLNFAAGQYDPLSYAAILREKVYPFDPDAVYYVAHQGEFYSVTRHLGRAFKSGYELPYPCLDEILREAGVTEETSWGGADTALKPHGVPITDCVYRGIVSDCRERGILPVWIYVPMPGITEVTVDTEKMLAFARDAGFVVVDLSHWTDGREPGDVKFSPTDYHANALGHRLIADQLFAALKQRPDALPILAAPGP